MQAEQQIEQVAQDTALADAFQRSADFLDSGRLTGSARTHPLVGTADYRAAAAALRELAALRASSPAERQPLHETIVMKMAKEVGFNLEPTANFLYTVRGNAAQVINLVHAVEAHHGIVTKESST